MRTKIIDIIERLVTESGKDKQYFLEGGCLIFAKLLRDRVDGQIYWLVDESHAVLEVEGKLWDCTGNVTNKYMNSRKWTEKELMEHDKVYKGIKKEGL